MPARRRTEGATMADMRSSRRRPVHLRAAMGRDTYDAQEELVHALSHGVGVALAAGAFAWLVTRALQGGPAAMLGAVAFGGSLTLLYLASTLYHGVPARWVRAKKLLQRCDHAGIYLLIAGTYTPVILLGSPTSLGLLVLGAVWSLGAVGVGLLLTPFGCGTRLQLALYLAMGWLVVVVLPELATTLSARPLALLTLGGLAYTGGVAFYVLRRRWAHAVWHGFVLAGSACHVVGVAALL